MIKYYSVYGFEDYYKIDSAGNVYSIPRIKRSRPGVISKMKGRKLKQKTDRYGYLTVCLCVNSKRKHTTVHRLLLQSAIGPSPLTVNHIDGNKKNNTLENLEYMTAKENVIDAYKRGSFVKLHGELNGWSKLKLKDVLLIRKQKGPKKDKILAERFKVSHKTIEAIRNRRSWRHLGV